jgi:hypothetical protein
VFADPLVAVGRLLLLLDRWWCCSSAHDALLGLLSF